MKIYLAGPITGNPNYKDAFCDAEQHLTKLGHVVLNPAHLPEGLGDCDAYMRICLPMIDAADVVMLLDGWEDSRGACREWGYAMALDKIVIDYATFRKDEVQCHG